MREGKEKRGRREKESLPCLGCRGCCRRVALPIQPIFRLSQNVARCNRIYTGQRWRISALRHRSFPIFSAHWSAVFLPFFFFCSSFPPPLRPRYKLRVRYRVRRDVKSFMIAPNYFFPARTRARPDLDEIRRDYISTPSDRSISHTPDLFILRIYANLSLSLCPNTRCAMDTFPTFCEEK